MLLPERVNRVLSVREYASALATDRVVRRHRRLSEPTVLSGEVDPETIESWLAEADCDAIIFPQSASPAPRRRRRRASSFHLSLDERDSLVASMQAKVEEERSAEIQVPKKLAAWGGSLDLRAKPLQADDLFHLEFLLKFNYPHTFLSLAKCFIKDREALPLVAALRCNYVLTELDLSGTKVTDATIDGLADTLRDNPTTLTSIDLRLTQISERGADRILQMVDKTPSLTRINGICVRDLENSTCVDLSRMSLRIPEALMLRRWLSPSLKSLFLAENLFDDRAAEILAEILRLRPSLTKVNLDNNRIGPRGIDSMVKSLGNLKSFSISANLIDGDDAATQNLLKTLRTKNSTLTHLDVSQNNISAEKELQERIKVNRALLHTPQSFSNLVDQRWSDPPQRAQTCSYEPSLSFDQEYIRRERRLQNEWPLLVFDDENGDDYILHPESDARRAPKPRMARHLRPPTVESLIEKYI